MEILREEQPGLVESRHQDLEGAVKHYITIGHFDKRIGSPKELLKEPMATMVNVDRGKDLIGLDTKTTAATSTTYAATASLSEKPSKAQAKDSVECEVDHLRLEILP